MYVNLLHNIFQMKKLYLRADFMSRTSHNAGRPRLAGSTNCCSYSFLFCYNCYNLEVYGLKHLFVVFIQSLPSVCALVNLAALDGAHGIRIFVYS